MSQQFNLRVYGLLINKQQQLLVTDEKYGEQYFTKFPGGGLEFGEGTKDCLVREFKEELGLDIEVSQHFYTTDFFQKSTFHPNTQIISIYYLVSSKHPIEATVSSNPHQIISKDFEVEVPRWIPCNQLNENAVTFPIDKLIIQKILQQYAN
jgi:8-oxo-dGTP diphosphatase